MESVLEKQCLTIDDMVHKYQDMMYRTAVKILRDPQLAEDALQEAWVKVYRSNVAVYQIEKLPAWLRTITSRVAIDLLRKEQRTKMCLLDENFNLEEWRIYSRDDTDQMVNWHDTIHEVNQCLNRSYKLKKIFCLKFYQGLSDQEIAALLNISYSAVKTRVHRARQMVKKYYGIEKKSEA
ncbi:RNA polymerase ECF-type sigma factor [Gracilibacillus halophilus YIM-C55.5]|uniref:RNA polymerase ECF-type sigma factor n=1 Tax=Gracilibacillus halophilus YIM-C55.5 TaxID=1308866 RepID=N4WLX9_9BACI|nr:RNA polymerase sigma factor [Gracilibacillus halophilus]ENH97167.1 RNA polymerase ECF-type sigma factor [Gracilibacillus halophilus YIM-C55.5]